VIILDTETSFSAERLVEIATNRFPFHFKSSALPPDASTTLPEAENCILLTSRVHVYNRITSSEALLQKYVCSSTTSSTTLIWLSFLLRLKDIQTEIIEKKVKLLIIDSIAALVRKEYDGGSIAQVSNWLLFIIEAVVVLTLLTALRFRIFWTETAAVDARSHSVEVLGRELQYSSRSHESDYDTWRTSEVPSTTFELQTLRRYVLTSYLF